MTIPTRRQGFARIVFDRVKSIKNALDKGEKAKACVAAYAGYAVELPSLIRNSGLAQTLAFLEHKASDETARAEGARSLRADFCSVLGSLPLDDTFDYLVATKRALEASDYFKRFAESVLDADRGQRGVQP